MADRSFAQRAWYGYLHAVSRLAAAGCLRIRCTGRENQPQEGGMLVLANHQSLFDPVLVGLTFDCRLNYLARETLFEVPVLGSIIQSLDAIPIDREGMGLAGLKETLRRIKRGEAVLIFPEGTRSFDGEVAPLKPGFAALAKRVSVPLVPVGIDGAYDAWPRDQMLPGVATVHIHVGRPIQAAETSALDERGTVKLVEERIRECHRIARTGRLRALGEARSFRPARLEVGQNSSRVIARGPARSPARQPSIVTLASQ